MGREDLGKRAEKRLSVCGTWGGMRGANCKHGSGVDTCRAHNALFFVYILGILFERCLFL